jgi:hypothetical protein
MTMIISGDGNITGLTAGGLPSATVTQATLATPVAGTGPAFSAYASGATSLNNATFTKITIDAEEFDTNNNFASSRFTPIVAGYYQINAQTSWGATATASDLITTIYKNGARYKDGTNQRSTNGPYGVVSILVYLNGSTDYVELYGYQNTGALLNVNGGTGYFTYFQASLVRSA